MSKLEDKKILVTGGTGFIGGRLVERLVLEEKADVRVLVRALGKAARIARFPLRLIDGDVADAEAVDSAVAGCDIVFHCAYDFGGDDQHKRDVSVIGTENICKSVLKHGADRLVHVSTFSVYGDSPTGALTEEYVKEESDDIYAKTKLAAEELVLDYYKNKGLRATILQPTIVYGPFSKPWTINPLNQLQTKFAPLIDGGAGKCNAVYIDDVVDAMILASEGEKALGETFLISGPEPVTWRQYYAALERLLGRVATVEVADKKIREMMEKCGGTSRKKRNAVRELFSLARNPDMLEEVKQIPAVRSAVKTFSGAFPRVYNYSKVRVFGRTDIHNIGPSAAPVQASTGEIPDNLIVVPNEVRYGLWKSTAEVKIDKAAKLLGYRPRYDFEEGMAVTGRFAKWANLV